MIPISSAFAAALSSVVQEALIELWELDLRRFGGGLHLFCNQTNEKGGAVVWQGREYLPYPVQGDGFAFKSDGAAPRPTLTVANIMGLVTAALAQDDVLIGATVTRRLVSARFLDAANFQAGNPFADPMQEIVQYFVLERVVSLTQESAVFELTIPSETTGTQLPSRHVIANLCVWQYRQGPCTYSGGACADINDNPTADITKDDCGKRLNSCRLRYGNAPLPFGGFPAADKVNN